MCCKKIFTIFQKDFFQTVMSLKSKISDFLRKNNVSKCVNFLTHLKDLHVLEFLKDLHVLEFLKDLHVLEF